jgi:ABC-type branched-subunit amino acid transport system substrate-binding protein
MPTQPVRSIGELTAPSEESIMGHVGRRAAGLALLLVLAAACGQKAGLGEAIPDQPHGSAAVVPSPNAARPSVEVTEQAGAASLPAGDTRQEPPRNAAAGNARRSSAGDDPAPATASGPGRSVGPSSPVASGAQPTSSLITPSSTGPAKTEPAAPSPASGIGGGPVDPTGVSDTVIKIGVHAPITGAAPIPQNAFDKGKDVYWKWLAERGGLLGRNVQIIFKDDQFNPAHAVQVCRELVEQDKVFMLFGVTGSDQITACARYAESAGVPYLSAGVNEDGLTGLRNYFAVSQTYAQQNRTIVGLIKNAMHKTKIAIVLNATPALDETQRSITTLAQAAGLKIVRQSRISKQASDAELVSEANQLRASGAEAAPQLRHDPHRHTIPVRETGGTPMAGNTSTWTSAPRPLTPNGVLLGVASVEVVNRTGNHGDAGKHARRDLSLKPAVAGSNSAPATNE